MKISRLLYRIGITGAFIPIWISVVSCNRPLPPETPSPTATQVTTSTPADTPRGDGGLDAPLAGPVPEAVAPQGLGQVSLPENEDAISRLFNNLPSTFQGRPRTDGPGSTGEINAPYGSTEPAGCGTVGLKATDISTGDFFPEGWTAEQAIGLFTTGADWNVEDFGRDGDLYWVEWNTACSTGGLSGTDSVFTTSWGDLGSPWMFSASAGDPDAREGLIGAFVTASG
jgi:hypothetical protein